MLLRTESTADSWQQMVRDEPSIEEIESGTAEVLSLSQRNLYHSLVALRRTRSVADVAEPFLSVSDAYSALYLRSMHNPEAVAAAWKSLAGLIDSRRSKAAVYSLKLAHGPWRLLDGWRASGVCWRYSLLVDFPEQLMLFTEAIRRDGFYASNLYWPLNELVHPEDRCPTAESFARRVLNLWVDGTVNPEWVERCAECLCENARRL